MCELEPEYIEELIEPSSLLPCVYSVSTCKCSFLFLSQKFYVNATSLLLIKYSISFVISEGKDVVHEVWFRFRFYNVAY